MSKGAGFLSGEPYTPWGWPFPPLIQSPLLFHTDSIGCSTFPVHIYILTSFVSYSPFFNSIFRHTNTLFHKNQQYPTPFYLSVLYYHGNPWLLRESILLPDSTIFSPIAILSAASKTQKREAHHPPWWTPPSLKNLDFKPFSDTFACKYPNSYGINWK